MIEMKAQTVEVEPMTPEQCWAEIEAVADIMSVPGKLQTELKNDPALGEQFKKNAKELLHIIVEHFDVGVSPDDTEEGRQIVELVNGLFMKNQTLQTLFTIRVLTRASVAMQQLPLDEMILSLAPVSTGDGVSEENVAELKRLESEERSAGMAKIDPRIMKIMNLGINAAGGQVQFAKIQYEVAQNLPEQFAENMEIKFTAQMIGAVMNAISTRAQSRDFTLAQIRSTIEMVIGSKQALTLANMTAYHMKTNEIVHVLASSAEYHINSAMADVTAPEPSAEKQQVKAEATHFAEKKATSFQFDGNRTVN